MTTSARIWIHASCHPAFRCGGWAYVRALDGAVSGAAGGERNTTAARSDLMALIAALAGAPAGADVVIHAASPGLAGAVALIVSPPEAARRAHSGSRPVGPG